MSKKSFQFVDSDLGILEKFDKTSYGLKLKKLTEKWRFKIQNSRNQHNTPLSNLRQQAFNATCLNL